VSTQPDRKRELLIEELKDTVGEDAVERADLDIDRALAPRSSRAGAALASSRLLLVVAGSVFAVVGVIASLALDSWLLFATVVVATGLAVVAESEKPAPTTEAQLEAEGVRDPAGVLGDLVEQVEASGVPDRPGDGGGGAS
jgi:Flp pilus assembly protein TadB